MSRITGQGRQRSWCAATSAEIFTERLYRAISKLTPVGMATPPTTSLVDFMEKTGPVAPRHYAFLVPGVRLVGRPGTLRPDEINHPDGDSGVYFDDPTAICWRS